MPLRETVAECLQYVKILASQLEQYGLGVPEGMPPPLPIELEGASTLIFDECGRLKYDIHNRLPSGDRPGGQATVQSRLDSLWNQGAVDKGASLGAPAGDVPPHSVG
jgi:hypothetical protein